MRNERRRNFRRNAKHKSSKEPLFKIMARANTGDSQEATSPDRKAMSSPVAVRSPSPIMEEEEEVQEKKAVSVKRKATSINKADPTKAVSDSGMVLGTSIKIYSRSMNMKTDELMKFLRNHRDFTVIGVLGGQWSGKSTILNRLCKISSDERGQVFPIASTSNIIRCSHRTTGLDVYVTQERFILIDTQPLLSSSVLSMSLKDEPAPYLLEPESLQICLFMYSVCHVVLVVSDWFVDMEMWRLLRSTFMLKQSMRSMNCVLSKDNPGGNIPATVFIVNKVDPAHMTFAAYENILQTMLTFFKHDKLEMKNAHVCNAGFASLLTKPKMLNLFFLPDKYADSSPVRKGKNEVDAFTTACEELRYQLFSMPKKTTMKLTEKDWLRTAARLWTEVESARALNQYVRVLKKQGIFR